MNASRALFAGVLFLWTSLAFGQASTCQPPMDPSEGVHYGNGGDVLVRRAPGSIDVKLLDFYENSLPPRSFVVDLGAPTLSVDDKVKLALARLERLDSGRADLYRQWYATFLAEACFLRDITLVDIPDSADVARPVGYEVEQIAVQIEPRFPEDRRYTINFDLWRHLDNDAKAGLILHELIYREAIKFNAEDSRGVRYLTAALAANVVGTWDVQSYLERLKQIGIFSAYVQGTWIDLGHAAIFHSNGLLKSAHVVYGTQLATVWGALSARDVVEFDEAGDVTKFSPAADVTFNIAIGGHLVRPASMISGCAQVSIPFPRDPGRGQISLPTNSELVVTTSDAEIRASGCVTFKDGVLTSASVTGAASFVDVAGVRCLLSPGAAASWLLDGSDRIDSAVVKVQRCTLGQFLALGSLKIARSPAGSLIPKELTLEEPAHDIFPSPDYARNRIDIAARRVISFHDFPVIKSCTVWNDVSLLDRSSNVHRLLTRDAAKFDEEGYLVPN